MDRAIAKKPLWRRYAAFAAAGDPGAAGAASGR